MTYTARLSPEDQVAPEHAKARGAFYTDTQIADFLVWWAVRSPHDRIMDPSFGGGVFLQSACRRLASLAGQPRINVFGVEIDTETHARIAGKLAREFGVPEQHLRQSDFFALDPQPADQVGVIVGNPPFIRYQRFSGSVRKQALTRAAQQGVRLTELSSSWAPFLVHSVAMLEPGGRLAMVIPTEITHAAYARPILQYLSRSFTQVTFLTFQRKLFTHLNEDTLLLLAEHKSPSCAAFYWRDLTRAGSLVALQRAGRLPLPGLEAVDAQLLSQGQERLIEYAIPRKARELYRELARLSSTQRLGDLVDVGIGYVTGDNRFFHLGPDEARLWDIPESFLRPAVRRGRSLTGLRFTHSDWRTALETADAGYLLHVQTEAGLPESVRRYLANGEAHGVSLAYKCRTRSPWFRVPHVYQPDAFLSYMSGTLPRLVVNDAGVVAPNSLHILRLHPHTTLSPDAIASLWQTSLTHLSAEIEGHALGGGMLKLEPTEAESVVIASPEIGNGVLQELAAELDVLVRSGQHKIAQSRADAVILQRGIGMSANDCALLRRATDTLRLRRSSRGAAE
jgi:adenine-specific DNA-methyltransferase